MSNVRSIMSKLRRLKYDAVIAERGCELQHAEKIILPGVGHFAAGMKNLHERGLVVALNEKVLEQQTPVLGICLGMQFLAAYSEEGDVEGLGWLDARVRRFDFSTTNFEKPKRIPHIGWNSVRVEKESVMSKTLPDSPRFYFVHSYYMDCRDSEDAVMTTEYGIRFASGVCKGNIYGAQFHPEKSHHYGIALIDSFLAGA
jgi:glutamine amidotransferase